MIGILNWEMRYGNTVLESTGAGSLNIDDQNVPAITTSIAVPYDADLFDEIDPQQTPPPRVTITGRYTQWASKIVADVSAYLVANAVTTVASLSTLWAGKTVADITAMFGTPLDVAAGGNLTPQEMSLDLHVREISHDYSTMTVSLASDEALLTDWAPTSPEDMDTIHSNRVWSTTQQNEVRYWVDPVLLTVLHRALDPNAYGATELSEDNAFVIDWTKWSSAWDMIRPALEDTDLKLRVNRTGVGFSLQLPENEIPGKAWYSTLTEADVSTARPVRSRSGDWYDSALVQASDDPDAQAGWPRSGGLHTRTYIESAPKSVVPTAAMALNLARRTRNRGELIDITAPIRLGVFMTDEFTYLPNGAVAGPDFEWRVKSVSYDFASATMRIRGERPY